MWELLDELGWTLRGGAAFRPDSRYAGLPDVQTLSAAHTMALQSGVPREAADRFSGGATGFVAELVGSRPGPTVGIRIDLDALPITESTATGHRPSDEGFASTITGQMHACGHDGHVAIGLRLAAALSDEPDFPGTVRLVVQPAEEGVRGGQVMVEAGACDDVDMLLAVHLGFGVADRTIAPATDLYATTKFRATYRGRSAHASNAPQEGRNALLAAATALVGLHSLPRFSGTPTRVNVGRLVGGAAPNIIADEAVLEGEIRAGEAAAATELVRRAGLVLRAAGDAQEVDLSYERTGYAVAARNDPAMVERLRECAARVGLRENGSWPLRASDDASVLMERVQASGGQALYLLVGSGTYGDHHSPTFDLDEDALDPAAAFLENLIRTNHESDETS